MKLEYLAPYIPYDLLLVITNMFKPDGSNHTTPLFSKENNIGLISALTQDNYKPILKPLKHFYGKKTAKEVMEELDCSLKVVHEIWALIEGDKFLKDISVEAYLVICKNHIDFNSLIQKIWPLIILK